MPKHLQFIKVPRRELCTTDSLGKTKRMAQKAKAASTAINIRLVMVNIDSQLF